MFLENMSELPQKTEPDVPEKKRDTAIVGGKTYLRPANFTDEQWNAYKQAVGAK